MEHFVTLAPLPMNFPSVYLHSPQTDFAPTQQLPEDIYLGRRLRPPGFMLVRCGCDSAPLVRIPRSAWMRLLPHRHLFACQECGARMLLPRKPIVYGAVYLPPPSRRAAEVAHRCTGAVFSAVCEKVLGPGARTK